MIQDISLPWWAWVCMGLGLIAFVVTFAIYMTNAENKLIYYVVRPLLNKHYDAQVRDRRI